jgi:hypothetical protein
MVGVLIELRGDEDVRWLVRLQHARDVRDHVRAVVVRRETEGEAVVVHPSHAALAIGLAHPELPLKRSTAAEERAAQILQTAVRIAEEDHVSLRHAQHRLGSHGFALPQQPADVPLTSPLVMNMTAPSRRSGVRAASPRQR